MFQSISLYCYSGINSRLPLGPLEKIQEMTLKSDGFSFTGRI